MKSTQLSAFGISLVLHLVIFMLLGMITYAAQIPEVMLAIESVFDEDRAPEEITQALDVAKDPSETMNVVAGSVVMAAGATGGTGAPAVSQQQVEASESLKGPEVAVNIGSVDVTGLPDLGTDLGEGEVTGEIGAVVEGYGAALGRITQEILRHMRESKVLVVWLFDESDSMKDDQQEIKTQFHNVYEELGIAQQQDKELKKNAKGDVLQTMILSYGKDVHTHLQKPTGSVPEVRTAIEKIKIDESGLENMCAAISDAVEKYGPAAKREKRKLILVVVTDESGDDGDKVDDAVAKAVRYKAPVYILGRESVFGYPYARLRWRDPKFGLDHWLQINRGPETPYPEALQFDGLHARWDAYSSGFGPYEQVRLAKETGGIFFVLPGEEENLVGQEAIDKRKFQFYDMKEYVPSLDSRREYEKERDKSKFRKLIWDIIVTLNPYKYPENLNIRHSHFSLVKEEFAKEGKVSFDKALQAMIMLDKAANELQKIKPLRDKEESQRWRANYDLILAQCMTYRVRLFQYLLAMDQHLKNFRQPTDPKNNYWAIQYTTQMIEPDKEVVKKTGINTQILDEQKKAAEELFHFVQKTHPRTPWSNRADHELSLGFSFRFIEWFDDPRRRNMEGVKVPKP